MIKSKGFINEINEDQINGSEKFLFKYCSVSVNSLSILMKSSLYLGPVHNLNDPFEADFTIDTEGDIPPDDSKPTVNYTLRGINSYNLLTGC